jgi:hypothetical protein
LNGNFLDIETRQFLQGQIRFRRSAIAGGTEFFRCTDDGDVFTPKNQVIFTAEMIENADAFFNGNVDLGSDNGDTITINGLTNILEDLKFNANRTIDWNVSTFSPTATAGGGQATPATVLGFLFIKINGANAKIPFYGV